MTFDTVTAMTLDSLLFDDVPGPADVAAAVWNLAGAIDGKTPGQAMQIIAAVAAGKVSGAGSGDEHFVGLDGMTPRVQVAVDPAGNRLDVTYITD
jgi:hypothetical protein